MPESSSGFEHEPSKRRKFKFTLSSLFVLTLLVAIFLAVAPFVDLDVLFLTYCAFIVFALAKSVRANGGVYYFQFACSLMILLSFLPELGPYSPSDTQVVVNAGLLGIGMWLSFNAVRHGHWSTKLAAILPLCMLSVFAFYALKFGVLHTDYVVDYWLARD